MVKLIKDWEAQNEKVPDSFYLYLQQSTKQLLHQMTLEDHEDAAADHSELDMELILE